MTKKFMTLGATALTALTLAGAVGPTFASASTYGQVTQASKTSQYSSIGLFGKNRLFARLDYEESTRTLTLDQGCMGYVDGDFRHAYGEKQPYATIEIKNGAGNILDKEEYGSGDLMEKKVNFKLDEGSEVKIFHFYGNICTSNDAELKDKFGKAADVLHHDFLYTYKVENGRLVLQKPKGRSIAPEGSIRVRCIDSEGNRLVSDKFISGKLPKTSAHDDLVKTLNEYKKELGKQHLTYSGDESVCDMDYDFEGQLVVFRFE